MSYCAYGSGYVTVVKEIPAVTLEEFTDAGFSINDYSPNTISDIGVNCSVYHDYQRFEDEEVEDALISLSPFIVNGDICFEGDDNEYWEYSFLDGEWYRAEGYLAYDEGVKIGK